MRATALGAMLVVAGALVAQGAPWPESQSFPKGVYGLVIGASHTDSGELTAVVPAAKKFADLLLKTFPGARLKLLAGGGEADAPTYERVATAQGGFANVHSFYKLYMVPGHGHGATNGPSNSNANPPC